MGLAATPILTTQIAAHHGWRWAFFIAGLPGFLAGLLIWRLVKEPEKSEARKYHGHKLQLRDYLEILRYRNIWFCCIGATGFIGWLFLNSVFAPLYTTEVAQQKPTTAGFLLGASDLGSFFLGFLLPSLSNQSAARRPQALIRERLIIGPMRDDFVDGKRHHTQEQMSFLHARDNG